MDKKEFDIKIRAMLKLNKTIHTEQGATAENIKRLNYLIIEMFAKGCSLVDIYKPLCTGKYATKEKYDLLCRITEQCKYPTLVYNSEVTYTDDLKEIKNSAMEESRVRASKWMKTISRLTNVSEDELYRFTQCYMLLEQFGREENVIDETASKLHGVKPFYIRPLLGECYHDRKIEIEAKLDVVSKLMCCSLKDFRIIQEIIDNNACKSLEEYQLLVAAYNSANSFFELKTKFDAENVRGVQGDTSSYVFARFKNGVPYNVNKYENSFSMADAACEARSRSSAIFANISTCVNTCFSESTETPDDDTM